ncbi:hypothetical protein G5V65_11395 [Rhodobacter sp. HX-7-19]|uniref:Uncharacterized protein n=1 Tax=Paragemmobacter kunshanensis TaxID=2583234 RepID=A0A6M1TZ42_9RHOB|nr:hypothetical protein [Rhodobacter kunshanensis]NGQ91502.1 hypothetical protein [Rhodobacter kunshanensis]
MTSIIRPDALRRMVAEWVTAGCTVEIEPDGKIRVTPPANVQRGPDPDLIDWGRK